jgi:thiol-disulfide isomerase/thioredoxin
MKPNDPFIIILVVALITLAILYLQSFTTTTLVPPETNTSILKQSQFPLAPELVGIKGYINTEEGFKLADVQGKVILIDFWTYSCINCIRTLPYLTAWDEKYRDKGLVIVGVHSPEFEFEKEFTNVRRAVTKHDIKYPVVLDNDFSTWLAYNNRFWPHKFLIDSDGFIRYDHIGEGAYDETESMIQKLLKERDAKIQTNDMVSDIVNGTDVDFSRIGTPELYFGYQFARGGFGNVEGIKPEETVEYTLPSKIEKNKFYISGSWKNTKDYMELVNDSGLIVLKYNAKVVNIVAGQDANLTIKLDDSYLTNDELGSDAILQNGKSIVTTNELNLYNLVDDTGYFEKTIEINVSGEGFRIYTFTFG